METEGTFVRDFYKGQTIFVTGYTGYLGKILVEKLLWSCPQVEKIFVLIRSKKGLSPAERLKKTFESMAFDRLKANYPDRLSKVVGISGDVTEEGLGLSEEDTSLVVRESSVVFHCAASVRFDDPLKVSAEINTRGTKRILDLAKQMPNLKRVVAVSTAYVNCDRSHVQEILYPPKMKWRDLLNIVDKVDETTLNILTQKMMGVMPNTYVFTKSISEHVVDEYKDELPIVLCRPSVVTAARKEPMPGWVDNFYGPTGMLLGVQTGALRVTHLDQHRQLDYIYSDYVIIALLICALQDPRTSKNGELRVLNLCSGKMMSYTTRELTDAAVAAAGDQNEKVDMNVIWVDHIKNDLWYTVNMYVKHLLSAYLIDALLALTGHTPLVVKFRRKIHFVGAALKHFTFHEFNFVNAESQKLLEEVDPRDEEFRVCLKVDKQQEVYDCVRYSYHVTKKTLMGPMFDDVSKTRKYINSLYNIDFTMVTLTCLGVAYFVVFSLLPRAMDFIDFFFLDLSFL